MPSLRRYLWLWSLLLTILFFLVIQSLPTGPAWLSLSSVRSTISILRPSDSSSIQCTRQWKPSDDNFPPAHEPVGPGTLRDVREERFYSGGTSTIESLDGAPHPRPAIYDPYPDYNGRDWSNEWKGSFQACDGPRGRRLSRWDMDDMVLAYPGLQEDFPFPKYGSYEALGLDGCSCTTRSSRLGAYGYTVNSTQSGPDSRKPNAASEVSWETVNWKALQAQCLKRNINRYNELANSPSSAVLPLPRQGLSTARDEPEKHDASAPNTHPRSAVVLRAWHDMEWTENLKQHIRSLVMELSLHSGAEYEVFLLTHVKDNDMPLYGPNEKRNVEDLKKRFIPPEFRDTTIFFNEQTLESWYPKVNEHKPIYQYLQPLQIFSVACPDFDFYWPLEMDARFTGHTYHFLERASEFAKRQPRKYLWERNAYFYIPGAHGNWTGLQRMVDSSMQDRPASSIWGSAPPDSLLWLAPIGPTPPGPTPQYDNYEWGVGEDADLITFLPIFDPSETNWVFTTMLWNLPEDIPRRTSPVAMGRYSNRLLHTIHEAQVNEGIGLVSEMAASSFALWHGLKAVSVPHPLYADGKWTPKELDRIVNKGRHRPEKVNGGPDSIWNWDHQFDHILYRMSYLFTAQAAEDFYRRWLGYRVDGGQFSDGSFHQDPQGRNWFDNGDLREDLYGPLCFPSMLLHPIKNTAPQKGKDMAVPV